MLKNKKIIKKIIMCIIIITLLNQIQAYSFYENDIENEEEIETISTSIENPNEEELKFNSKVVVAYDRKSNKIIYNKNASNITAMASTTKIMTAIIVLENSNLNDVVTISKKAGGTGGSRLGLKYNDKATVENLLYGLLLRSGNDAAIALAEHVGGSVEGFVKMMNDKALIMELYNTHFTSPHGLDNSNHFTTGKELAKMADYALENETFRKIVGTKNINIVINGEKKNINNTNELLGNLEGVYGVKTGFTNNAGRCLVTAIKYNDLDYITVVIGANTKKERTTDSIKIINYIKNQYENYDLKSEIENDINECKKQINSIEFIKGKETDIDDIQIELSKELPESIMIKKNEDKPYINLMCVQTLKAPVNKYQIIGRINIYYKGDIISKSNIIIMNDIKRKNVNDYFFEFLQKLY